MFLSRAVYDAPPARDQNAPFLIGVLPGEGIGPEVVGVALRLLDVLEKNNRHKFTLRFGGDIGVTAKNANGAPLPAEIIGFCREVFARNGAILNGPGGDRYVYDLRVVFDLFCKISPLRVAPELIRANRLKASHVENLDILLVRENASGFYQGKWSATQTPESGLVASQTCSYSESEVCRIVEVAARLAASRQGKMAVVVKDGGAPTLSQLWRDCARQVAAKHEIEYSILNIDLAAYQLIQHPRDFDVVVAPNLFGDILGDLGAVLLGSRGLSFSGNFAANGAAVYQTNHGSGYDLVGQNKANPVGQIFSMAMLLRESFGLHEAARHIENAVAQVWRDGWRTFDIEEDSCKTVGTQQMGDLVVAALTKIVARHSATAAFAQTSIRQISATQTNAVQSDIAPDAGRIAL